MKDGASHKEAFRGLCRRALELLEDAAELLDENSAAEFELLIELRRASALLSFVREKA